MDRITVVAGLNGVGLRGLRGQMRDDLVAIEVEVDPVVPATPFRAPEQPAVKGAGLAQVSHREGQVEARKAHGPAS
jgi:hypothetical protein